MSYNGKTKIFSGWGGSGKTSLSSALYQKYNGKFISDDLTIIGDTNLVYFNPSLLNIYDYNIRESSYFRDKKIQNEYEVCTANNMYHRVASCRNVDVIYFLQKKLSGGFKIKSIEKKSYSVCANMLFEIILHEIKVLHYVKKSIDSSKLSLSDCLFFNSFNLYAERIFKLLNIIEIKYIELPEQFSYTNLDNFVSEENI